MEPHRSVLHKKTINCRLLLIIIYNGASIDPLRDLIVKSKPNYNFRKSAHIVIPRTRTEIGRSPFKHRAALCWNLLPNSFKKSPSLGSFKRLIRGNKNILKTIRFEKASCSISLKSMDLNIFRYVIIDVNF